MRCVLSISQGLTYMAHEARPGLRAYGEDLAARAGARKRRASEMGGRAAGAAGGGARGPASLSQ